MFHANVKMYMRANDRSTENQDSLKVKPHFRVFQNIWPYWPHSLQRKFCKSPPIFPASRGRYINLFLIDYHLLSIMTSENCGVLPVDLRRSQIAGKERVSTSAGALRRRLPGSSRATNPRDSWTPRGRAFEGPRGNRKGWPSTGGTYE